MIKHIWFDFSDTIASINKDAQNKFRYDSYASAVGRSVTPELINEYEKLFSDNKNSNSAVFRAMGKEPGFWSKLKSAVSPKTFYYLTEDNIPEVLEEMSKIIPISIFSNIDVDKVLPALRINTKMFIHILSSSMIDQPKPALEGYYKVIELSGLKPEEILYVGDDLGKDIIPAKKVGIKAGTVFRTIKEADYSFKDFKDILEFVKTKNK